jgi:hypothetical protein
MKRPSLSLAARGLTVAGGVALLVSLFLTWSGMSLQQLALLAVTANGDLGHLSLTLNAWDAYAGVAAALTAVALLVIATGVLDRLALILPAGLVCLAALVFAIVELSDPPSALPPSTSVALPSSGLPAHSTAGAGEPLAIVALVLAGIGMWGMLATAHAERRRRRPRAGGRPRPRSGGRRRQRATGSAARSSGAAVSAGEPADGPA